MIFNFRKINNFCYWWPSTQYCTIHWCILSAREKPGPTLYNFWRFSGPTRFSITFQKTSLKEVCRVLVFIFLCTIFWFLPGFWGHHQASPVLPMGPGLHFSWPSHRPVGLEISDLLNCHCLPTLPSTHETADSTHCHHHPALLVLPGTTGAICPWGHCLGFITSASGSPSLGSDPALCAF